MRPGQNKRMRGRPTNNRRGPNPLTRSYESNGPDVKIRGNAHHVAEKYLQLARDAHTGGDPVAAENYLQHAEHYYRLIAAAQTAQALAQGGQQRPPGEDENDLDDDGDFDALSDRFASPAERQAAFQPPAPQPGFPPQPIAAPNAPQPFADRPAPYEGERQGGADRGGFAPRQDRQQGNRFQDRGPRPDRPYQDRNEGYRGDNRQGQGRDGRPRDFRPYRDPQPVREPVAEASAAPGLPSFITASPRINNPDAGISAPPPEAVASPPPVAPSEVAPAEFESPPTEGTAFPARGRRRRLRSPYGFGGASSGEGEQPDAAPEIADDTPVRE
jgi:Domain of unknown function (DUF4167)